MRVKKSPRAGTSGTVAVSLRDDPRLLDVFKLWIPSKTRSCAPGAARSRGGFSPSDPIRVISVTLGPQLDLGHSARGSSVYVVFKMWL